MKKLIIIQGILALSFSIFSQTFTGKGSKQFQIGLGLSIRSGPAFAIPKSSYKAYGSDLGYMLYGGPHAGIRFYLKEKLGLYAEIGYGKAYFNGGIVFNL